MLVRYLYDRMMYHLLHPVGTRTNAGTLGSDTEGENLGNQCPGDRSPAVLSQMLAPAKYLEMVPKTYSKVGNV
jgi:hypothetical protein